MKATRLALLLIWVGLPQYGKAQYHVNMWTRATLSYPATKKLRTDAEIQYRRQNGFEDHTMYRDPLMLSFRAWAHYQATKNLKVSVSPFAWFSNYRIIQQLPDEYAVPGKEIRCSAAAELQQQLSGKWYATGRVGAEYRMWQSSQPNVVRARLRAGLRYEAGKRLNFLAYDELLMNVAGASPEHTYDHNRVVGGASIQCTRWLKTEAGYLYIDRLPLANPQHIYEHNIYLNVVTDIGKLQHPARH